MPKERECWPLSDHSRAGCSGNSQRNTERDEPQNRLYRQLYRLPADRQGVLVTGVMPLSPADDRGLRVGDLILSVQMVQVKAPADVTQQFERMRQQGKEHVLVLMWGDNATKSIALPLSSGSSQPEQAAPY